jgi:hypothetical protein
MSAHTAIVATDQKLPPLPQQMLDDLAEPVLSDPPCSRDTFYPELRLPELPCPRLLLIQTREEGIALRTFDDLFRTTIVSRVPLGPILDYPALYEDLREPVDRFLRLPLAVIRPDRSIELPSSVLLPAGTHVTLRLMPPHLGFPWLLLERHEEPDLDETWPPYPGEPTQ